MSKPVYDKPTGVSAAYHTDTTMEVVFRTSPYANFFTVKYSLNSDMSSAKYYKSQDINANAISLEDLIPGRRYYIRVAVSNWEGIRLSPYSTKIFQNTDATYGV